MDIIYFIFFYYSNNFPKNVPVVVSYRLSKVISNNIYFKCMKHWDLYIYYI